MSKEKAEQKKAVQAAVAPKRGVQKGSLWVHRISAEQRSAKKLKALFRLADTKRRRLRVQAAVNPRTTKEAQMSTFIDPRSQARVAEQLAPVPQAKKRVYKAKSRITLELADRPE